MKTIVCSSGQFCRRWLVAGLLCWAGFAQGVTLSVLPSSVSNTYTGQIALQIGGLTNGETVAIDKYLDANTNGVIDAADWLVQSFRLTDNQASVIGGVTNINVPRDLNPTSGAITAELGLQSVGIAQTVIGKYLYRLASPTGHFGDLTNGFTIVNAAYEQGFTGKVQCGGTNVPYAGVLVFGGEGSPIAETVADGSGTYTIQVAPGVYPLGAFKNGYVSDMGTMPTLALGAGAPITTNLNLIPATQSISGRFVDATNSSIGLPGMLVVAQSSDNLLVLGFTDTNGGFAVPVTASGWGVGLDDQQLPSCGYLSLKNQPSFDTTTGSVSGVAIAFSRGTALFCGTVKDDQDHPLAGLSLNAEDQGGVYSEGRGVTDTNGNYAIAVLAGAWHVKPSNDSPGYGNYLFSGVNTNVTDGQAARVDFTGCPGVTVSGCVRGDGAPLEGLNVQVGTIIFHEDGGWNWQQTYQGDSTDSGGCYSLIVPPGTNYYVQVNPSQGSPWLGQFYSNAMDAVGATVVVALTDAAATNINFNLQQGASVSGRVRGGGVRLSGINVKVGTITFSGGGEWDWGESYYGTTDSSGNYNIMVPPGANYYARSDAPEGSPWLEQFYDHVSDVSSATVFSALTNAPATSINFDLEQGTRISGRVYSGGFPLENVSIQVGLLSTNESGDWQWQHVSSGQTDSNGDYAIAVTPDIAYAVEYMTQSGDSWLEQYYSNATDAASATLVIPTVAVPATNINFNLQQGAEINGWVLAGGSPVENVHMAAVIITYDPQNGWNTENIAWTQTAADGSYTLIVPSGVTCGVRAQAPDGTTWLEQYYSIAADAASATLVTPTVVVPATNIDFVLSQGAVISGRVLGEGVPLSNKWVQVGLLSTNESGNWQWEYMNSAGTDNQGYYSAVVPPGLGYVVQYMPQYGDPWLPQFYSNATSQAGATWVTPLIATPATNIDFNLQHDDDVNDNGVPDSWEEEHFGSLGWMSDTSDWDEDGSPDISEYWAGTSPTNNASFLGIVGSAMAASGAGFVIHWSSVAGKTYCIERASDLVTGFDTTVKSGIDATPTMNTETDTTAGVTAPVFYRVRVETP